MYLHGGSDNDKDPSCKTPLRLIHSNCNKLIETLKRPPDRERKRERERERGRESFQGNMTTTSKSLAFVPMNGFDNIQTNDNNVDMTAKPPCWKWYCPPGIDSAVVGTKRDRDDKLGWWKLVFANDGASEEKSDGIEGTSSLHIAPPAKKDFWRKTYYEPLLVKDDGSFLYTTLSMDSLPATIETSFTITNPKNQFDQAGILIRIDKEHWIKTGIEVVDNIPRLSCVVTNGFSDWSTQSWPSSSLPSSSPPEGETNKNEKKAVVEPELRLRVHLLPQNGGSYVVEAAPRNSNEWSMIRICHMNPTMNSATLNDHEAVQNAYQGIGAPSNSIMVGIFAACPIDQDGSCVTKFHDISITPGSTFVHTAS